MAFQINPIGTISCGEDGFSIKLKPEYRNALAGLEGFGYLQVLWWFDGCDNAQARATLTEKQPYVHGPETLGVFATRSPNRPNPIAVSPARLISIDQKNGVVQLAWIDARDGTPVVDLKPYTPSIDRVETPCVPAWCGHWPKSVEESGDFPWEKEFNF